MSTLTRLRAGFVARTPWLPGRIPVRGPIPRLAVATALLLVALVGVGFFATAMWRAGDGEQARTASTRDVVAAAARREVATLTTLDYRSAGRDLNRWQQAVTGDLSTQLQNERNGNSSEAKNAKSVATGAISSVAVTDIGPDYRTASVMVAATIRIARDGKKAQTRKAAFDVSMSDTEQGWKVSELDTVGGALP